MSDEPSDRRSRERSRSTPCCGASRITSARSTGPTPGASPALHLLALLAFVPWFFSWTGVLLVPIGMYIVRHARHQYRPPSSADASQPRLSALAGAHPGPAGDVLLSWNRPPIGLRSTAATISSRTRSADPHSPIESFFWSHFGWYMVKVDPARRAELVQRYAKDVMRDPLYAFLECNRNWLLLIAIVVARVLRARMGRRAGAGHGTTAQSSSARACWSGVASCAAWWCFTSP